MTLFEQMVDSVTIIGNRLTITMFFPMGLQYHALHHLFPAIPYHNLGEAHRRLMEKLPGRLAVSRHDLDRGPGPERAMAERSGA